MTKMRTSKVTYLKSHSKIVQNLYCHAGCLVASQVCSFCTYMLSLFLCVHQSSFLTLRISWEKKNCVPELAWNETLKGTNIFLWKKCGKSKGNTEGKSENGFQYSEVKLLGALMMITKHMWWMVTHGPDHLGSLCLSIKRTPDVSATNPQADPDASSDSGRRMEGKLTTSKFLIVGKVF